MADTPPALRCPITLSTFLDPVIASDGHTYERAGIMEWMKHNTTSPLTREALTPALTPNPEILEQVIEERARRGLPTLSEERAAIKIQSAFRARRAEVRIPESSPYPSPPSI